MNAIMYAVNEIKNQIPYEILSAGFMVDELPELANTTTLEDKITRKLLRKRVMLDANIVGGTELIVPIGNVVPAQVTDYYTVFPIPPEYTNNREIVSVLGLVHMPYMTGLGNGSFGSYPGMAQGTVGNFNPLLSVADRIGSSAAPSGVITNAHTELVSYNTILIYAYYALLGRYGVRVIVENDSNLNNIQPRSYKSFSMLCVLACKAYIYNKLIIHINSGYLASGQDLGIFKSIIESYDSAEEEYRTYIQEVWGKVAHMNDTTRYYRYLGSMIQPDL